MTFSDVLDEAIEQATVNPDGLRFHRVRFMAGPEDIGLEQVQEASDGE